MKPIMFKQLPDLISFIKGMPEPEGETKLGNAADLKAESLRLAPRMFELREILVKSPKGVGSYKSLYRYADVATDNIEKEVVETLRRSMEEIDNEVEELLAIGAAEPVVENLRSARGAAAIFRSIAESINGFRDRQKKLLAVIEAHTASLVKNIEDNQRTLAKVLGKTDANTIRDDYVAKLANMRDLTDVLDRYSEVQICFNGLLIR